MSEYSDPFASSESTPPVVLEGKASGDTTIPRGGPIADGRRSTIAPAKPMPEWPDGSVQDVGDGADGEDEDGDLDYTDLAVLNKDLLHLRVRRAKVRRAKREKDRDAVAAKVAYNRAMRRSLVGQSGGSAESRKANAELLCEDLEVDMIMKAQIADEYSTLFKAIRDDEENVKVVSYNLRVS
jgi:hypothetical protein